MPSRSNLDLRDSNGRPRVGEADAATRSRMLRQALDQPTKSTGVVQRKPAQPLPGGPVRSTYDQLRLRGQDTDSEVKKRT